MAASADQYIFRYRQPAAFMPATPEVPVEDVEYGIGNDIRAFYVAPIGSDFSKKIPVATQDVVEWRRDSGSMPDGITLDVASGSMSGSPVSEGEQSTLWHGYDSGGNRIARAEMHFTVFEPVGVPQKVDFYTHVGTYFYAEIPSPESVTVHEWKPVADYAESMETALNAFSGTPTVAAEYELAWRGFDYMGNEVAYAHGPFLVEDGPKVEESFAGELRLQFGDQTADKSLSEKFAITPVVQKSLGPVTWRLVADTVRPTGLTFSSETGVLGGVFDEFETSATFRIEARDSYDGTLGYSTPFTLSTLPAVADLSSLDGAEFRGTVGSSFYRKFSSEFVLPGAKWEIVSGILPDGLVLDEVNGRITGTPLTTETQPGIVIRVSGPGMTTVEGGPFTIRVQSEAIQATTTPVSVRIGTPFKTEGVSVTGGTSQGYEITTASRLSPTLELYSDTGVISAPAGVDEVGYHNAYLKVENGPKDRWAYVWQSIAAYNPLDVTYKDMKVERRKTERQYPEVSPWTIIGEASYSIAPTAPAWMSFDSRTGRLDINPRDPATEGTHGPFRVTITDSTGSKPSEPFMVEVEKRPALETVVNDKDAQRYVQNGYRLASAKNAYDGVSYSMTSVPANWPSTLRMTSDGWLVGTTTDPVGTVYSGVVITATDGEGATDPSDSFDITVLEPASLGGLYGSLQTTVTWVAGKQFAGSLPPLSNGFGQISYSFDPPISGIDLTNTSTGSFSGAVAAAGKTTHTFSVEDDTDRPAATGTLTLDIREELSVTAPLEVTMHRGMHFDEVVVTPADGIPGYQYAVSGRLPGGLQFMNGSLYGTPTEEGDFPLTVSVTDRTGDSKNASFTLKVEAPLPFAFSFDVAPLFLGQTGGRGILKSATLENPMGDVSKIRWTIADESRLPPGVIFQTDGVFKGSFTGVPTADGRYPGIVIDAVDSEGRAAPQQTIELVVSRSGQVGFADQTFTVRAGAPFTQPLAATNVVQPIEFTSTDQSGLPYALVLNAQTGTISGSFVEPETYGGVGVTVKDDLDRAGSATFAFKAVGAVEVETPEAPLAFKQFQDGRNAVGPANIIGKASYALVAGTLPAGLDFDPATGSFFGIPEIEGTFGGFVVEVTDSFDGTAARTEPFEIAVAERDALGVDAPSVLVFKQYGDTPKFDIAPSSNEGSVTYTISPALPGTLKLVAGDDGLTATITGSSDEMVPETEFTITAVDAKGGARGTHEHKFKLTVEERDALGVNAPDAMVFKQYGDAPAFRISPVANIGDVTYTISPALPGTLQLVANDDGLTAQITGSSDEVVLETEFTITAVDSKAGERGTWEHKFKLTVEERDALGVNAPDAMVFKQYGDAPAFRISPVANIGDVTYTISPALPGSLQLIAGDDGLTSEITGSSDEVVPETEFTITAIDSKAGERGTWEHKFKLTVEERDALLVKAPETLLLKRHAAPRFAATVEAEIGAVVYDITPDLPSGLELNPTTGEVVGAPVDTVDDTVYTITAIDEKGGDLGTADTQFTLTVIERDPLLVDFDQDVVFKQYAKGTSFTATSRDPIGAVSWAIAPSLPDGLTFVDGVLAGTPSGTLTDAVYTISAVDEKGGDLGTDEASFNLRIQARDPLGIDGVPSFEFAQYFEGRTSYSAVNPIDGATFAISPALPDGLTLNEKTGEISGTSEVQVDAAQYTLTVTDAHDSVDKEITISVGERAPLEIVTKADQPTILGRQFDLQLDADKVVGDGLAWEHVSGDLPAGIEFDADTGSFSGIPTAYGTTSSVTIKATDEFGGSAERTFVFTVIHDGTQIELTASGATTRVGHAFSIPSPVATATVGNVDWSMEAGTTGLVINRKTGAISGTPSAAFDEEVTVTVSDATGREESRVIRVVSVQEMMVSAPSLIEMSYNRPLPTAIDPTVTGNVGAVWWTVSGNLPEGVTFDGATGRFSGIPKQIGTFGPVVVTAADTLPGTASKQISISVAMNEDPIELSVTNHVTKVGHEVETVVPAYDNHLGYVTFFSTDLAGTGLSIDPRTGVLSGTPTALMDRYINISVKDSETLRVTSRPLRMQVIPAMQLTIPAQVTISALTNIAPVQVGRQYVVGDAVWNDIDQSEHKLPEGILFDTATGRFTGSAKEIGEFGPFVVTSTDSLGDTGSSIPFKIKVNPGTHFLGLAAADLPNGMKRIETYSYDLSQHLTNVGMDASEVTWTLGAGSPPGLTLANGILSGTPALSGEHVFDVTVSYKTYSAVRQYKVVIDLPQIDLELLAATFPEVKRRASNADNSFSFDLKEHTRRENIEAGSVAYTLEPIATGEAIPAGVTVSPEGLLAGTANSAAGIYSFRIKASFVDGTDENISSTTSYTLTVVDEINFELVAGSLPQGSLRVPYEFDFGTLLGDGLSGVTAAEMTWSWKIDPARDPSTKAVLPAGLGFAKNVLRGTPSNTTMGSYDLLVSASFDGRTTSHAYRLEIGLPDIAMDLPEVLPEQEWMKYANIRLTDLMTIKNIPVSKIVFSAPLPVDPSNTGYYLIGDGLKMHRTGLIHGNGTRRQTYSFELTATYKDGDEELIVTKTVSIAVVGQDYLYKEMAMNLYSSCGMTSEGDVYCAGTSTVGSLGDGGKIDGSAIIPQKVALSGQAKRLFQSKYLTGGCAELVSRQVECWGQNLNGMIDPAAPGSLFTPVPFTRLSNVDDLQIGIANACALKDGDVYCWGDNAKGQLGDGTKIASSSPVKVVGIDGGAEKLAFGNLTSCAVMTDGKVKCWGYGLNGELGNGLRTDRAYADYVPGLEEVTDISLYGNTACVISGGQLKCWGYNSSYVKFGGTSDRILVPITLDPINGSLVKVENNDRHVCVLTSAGEVGCFGAGTVNVSTPWYSGFLGDGVSRQWNEHVFPAVRPVGLPVIEKLFSSAYNSCAITTTGKTYCWGMNRNGQLSNGTGGSNADAVVPTPLGG
jgi:Alpha-tubulin suppressor and related RCC1 domain-containing proteins